MYNIKLETKGRDASELLRQLIYIFGISMVPVVELRVAIPVGIGLGVMVTAMVGNLLPVPFLILFTRRVFEWLRKISPRLEKIVARLEKKAASKEHLLRRYALLGLCILVAIPLPGTGAWTGALVAAVFDIRLKHAFPAIVLGVVVAGIIVTLLSCGVAAMI